MNCQDLFAAYYEQYRNEATIPSTDSTSPDDEFVIFVRLANEAINRWSNYDNTFWRELFTTAEIEGESPTIVTGQTDYDAPDNFYQSGGFLSVKDANGNTVRTYAIKEANEVQFLTDSSQYAWFFGNPNDGYTLRVNPAPDSAVNGLAVDFAYYKSPTLFTTGGTEVSEMAQPYFIVHRALWSRFRGSRNPYSDEAKTDAEDVLKTMQMQNNSGNWANPWTRADNSGNIWGQAGNSSGGF